MRSPTIKARAKAATQVKKRVKGAFVVPDYVLRLMELVGPTAAAKLIGTTPGTLHKARNANAVTQAFEVAARGAWHEQGYADLDQAGTEPLGPRTSDLGEAVQAPTAEGVSLLLVQVPKGREAILEKAVIAIGGTIFVQG